MSKTEANNLVPINVLVDGKRISYGIHGTGKPVVLVHGTPSSSYIWRNVVPLLVKAGFKVYLYDLLGYGLSERPWDPAVDTSVSGQVPILKEMLNIWGLDHIHLVAHDIGGAIAQRFSLFDRSSIKSLTLIDTVSFDSWPSRRTNEQMQVGLDKLMNRTDAEHRQHFEEWILSTVHNKQNIRDTSLQTYIDYISGPIGQGSLFQHQVSHYDPKHTTEISDCLKELGEIPVQIIWGQDDAWQVIDWAHKLHSAIPNSELSILPKCGHFSMEDKPESIAEKLVSFILNVPDKAN